LSTCATVRCRWRRPVRGRVYHCCTR
jgi:hypothetical protein